jgi:autotransporter-associated beta strand protein
MSTPQERPTPREEMEMRLTALLMGELPPEEATALEAQVAADPVLAALQARLRKAVELLREASNEPEAPASPAPVRLSSERRARLLAHFQTPRPKPPKTEKLTRFPQPTPTPGDWKRERDWSWVIPLGVAATVVALVVIQLGGSVLTKSVTAPPNFAAYIPERTSRFAIETETAAPEAAPDIARGNAHVYKLEPMAPAEPMAAPSAGRIANVTTGTAVPTFNVSPGKPSTMAPAMKAPAAPNFTGGLAFNSASKSADNLGATNGPVAAPIYLGQTTANGANRAKEEAKLHFATDLNERGWVEKTGSASLTLKGVNTYAGGTTVTAGGTLALNNDFATGISIPNQSTTSNALAGGAGAGQGSQATKILEDLHIVDSAINQNAIESDKVADSAKIDTQLAEKPFTISGTGGRLIVGKDVSADDGIAPLNAIRPATPALREKSRQVGVSDTRAEKMKQAGDVAMQAKDYEKATAYYRGAVDLTPNASASRTEHGDALRKFSDASTKLAEQRITEGRYADAEKTLQEVLDDRYDPQSKKATTILSRLQQPDYYNKTISPKSQANVEQVKQLFVEAQGLYDTGRYSLAKKRADQILSVDPNNIAARRIEEKIDRAMSDYGIAAYNETRADATAKSDMAWARPTRRFPAATAETAATTEEKTETLKRKLDSIVIPKLELRNATVREAIDYLKKKSVELDGASPAGEKGANIVLKTENMDKAAAAPAGSPTDPRITVSLTDIPLTEALRYVTGLANLKFTVEPYAVAVVPITENTDVLLTKEWKIPADLIPPASGPDPNSPVDRETVKNWLIANGLSFNGASSAVLIKKSNRLIVRNTQDQLDLVDNIVKAAADDQAARAAKAAAVPTAPIPQPEIQTSENAFSTFSLNVSDVSFKLAAASLEQGHMPDPASVRSEEFINAFNYRDPEPAPGAPLAFAAERARYPFAQNRDLLRFSVKTAAAGRQAGRPLNIVLLLDKSGSMERADRVNIVREALRVLATQLQPQDKLSIVTFARTPHLWADGVAGDKVNDVIARVNEITPEGGTNLEAALDLGYETAHRYFTADSVNRVVLFTDGAANLGDINPDALTKKVEAQRKQGIALDCFGIGWEGYNDNLLEQLTRNADGRYGFINTPEDAASNFATQLAGALQVAASDVKVQVEFNPQRVKAYRQIGYATHQLTKEQFRDNTVNAAQIGAAERGNALYVVEVDPRGEGDLAKVHVRFRVPGTSDYREHEWPVPFTGEAQPLEQSSSALRLAGAASAFSEMLAANPYATEVTSDRLLNILNGVPPIYGADPRPTKLEWMIRQARSLSGR